MRQIMLFLTCGTAAVMLGCVPSLQPIVSDEKDLVFEQDLIGTWVKPNSQLAFKLEKGVVKTTDATGTTINEAADRTYVITATDENGHASKLAGCMVRLDGNLFFDTTVIDPDIKGFAAFHMLPVHLFTKISLHGDTLTYATLNAEWMKKLHEEKKLSIRHEFANAMVILTADTPELQGFLRANAGNADAFQKPTELKRKK